LNGDTRSRTAETVLYSSTEPNNQTAMTLFERIAARQIPADIVYEDDSLLAFRDIKPQAPIHIVLIPKKASARISEAGQDDQALLGRLLLAAPVIAKKVGVEETGYRLVINNGRDGGETVPHLHCHILGGRQLGWPPG
jgi:histidine triad (HIT) family protein